ncbi:mismatch-specific DNA-glycosylase [Alicyclobacillus dauci]|uniref:Mismatch-specific DNA-glycosylase n=1 Tax=Alicyclobacillus dauci TaxID=1475485 RepID=A0ABY6Z452_9BACL|nr:mismatch-specific DNA-glycosylase [Alicyclobacillus dauci]WAH37662.1 mismatch-specific DNA-glycosylase [Alicyclobacillus dauci]
MTTELLKQNLKLLFIGFNPSPKSAETGWNYAGPNNRFYRILYEAGFTSRLFTPSESRILFDDYDFGFTNLVKRPTPRASDLTTAEYRDGAVRLLHTLTTYQPTFACFVGKGVYHHFSRRQKSGWGWTEHDIPNLRTRFFVAPGTSGLVRLKLAEQVSVYRELCEALKEIDSGAR